MTLAALFLAGLAVTAVAAVGVRILLNFSHRQLEVCCRLRRRRELFGRVLDLHDDAALAAEMLQALGLVLLISTGTLIWSQRLAGMPLWQQSAWLAAALVLLLAITSWIPWAVSRQWGAPLLLRTWWFWHALYVLSWPCRWGMRFTDAVARRLADEPDRPEKDEEEDALEDEIMTMVTAGEREGLLESDMRDMIEGVFELGDANVSDIMTPRSRVDAIEVHLGWPEILEMVVRSGRTRLPVYEQTLDNVVGVLYVKDLLPDLARQPGEPARPLKTLLREPWFLPRTMPLDELLDRFRRTRRHLAIVVDEYQMVLGVVTIEDVLEEIVGEIVDESDKEERDGIRTLSDTSFEVDGSVHLGLVNERLGLNLPESDEFDTLAGYLVSRLGRIPQLGERVEHGGARITVLARQPRFVERLLIETSPVQTPSS